MNPATDLRRLFPGDSEMARRMRELDWAATPLGPVERWPQTLCTVVRLMLGSRYAMWLGWGERLTFFCNDAYRPTLGVKRDFLGAPASKVWAEVWGDVVERVDGVLRGGQATWDEGLLLFLERSGFPEETFHTFSYSPVHGDHGTVEGMLCVVTEDSDRVIGERRLRVLHDLAARGAGVADTADACRRIEQVLAQHRRDVPFSCLYLVDAAAGVARLGMSTGDAGAQARPHSIALDDAQAVWPLGEVLRTAQPVEVDVPERAGQIASGPWPDAVRRALVLPVLAAGQSSVAAVLVAGVSTRRELDQRYREFFGLVAGQTAATLVDAQAFEAERRRAEALAEIDRAKTAFFTNVSHEFRTPLALMLAPLEDALDELPPGATHQLVATARRNAQRLRRLVDTLLDFARVEGGRSDARFAPTDLAAFTADLASTFRSVCERAGLVLEVDCAPLPEPVYVDPGLWEKVVLNLLSNAFKFTLEGGIRVTLDRVEAGADGEARARLAVTDTGCGIAPHHLPLLFRRFQRIEGTPGRSFEGSGIGLSLVAELVRLHGGVIEAHSTEGAGTRFVVELPFGSAHLPPQALVDRATGSDARAMPRQAAAYVGEALQWLPVDDDAALVESGFAPLDDGGDATEPPPEAALVLVADDNADLRDYLRRLLGRHWRVRVAADGEQAWACLQDEAPALLLCDVMMPQLDGFGLLARVRSEPRFAMMPVLLLSARAGEDARIEGLQAGADDYIGKPFSARDLLARVGAHLALSRARDAAAAAVRDSDAMQRRLSDLIPYGGWTTDRDGVPTYLSPQFLAMTGRTLEEHRRGWRQSIHPDDASGTADAWQRYIEADGRADWSHEFRVRGHDGRYRTLLARGVPVRDGAGRVNGHAGFNYDYTEAARLRELDREQQQALERVAMGEPLADSLVALTAAVEKLSGGLRAAVVVPDDAGNKVAAVYSAQLPPVFTDALSGAPIDEAFGTCGVAIREARAVTCSDVAAAAPWGGSWRATLGAHGIRACHSQPSIGPGGRALASLFLCLTDAREPDEWERRIAAFAAHVAGIAIVRERVEASLRDERERLRALVDQSVAGVAQYDLEGRFIDVNARFCEIVGRDRAGLLALHMFDITHGEDLAASRAVVAQLLRGERSSFSMEKRYLRPDGSVVWVRKDGNLVRDTQGRPRHVAAIVVDMTERRQADARLRLVMDAVPGLIAHVDADERYRMTNRAYETWFGVRADELHGRTLREVVGEAAYEALRPHVRAALAGHAVRFEVTLPYLLGGFRFVRADYVPDRRADGKVEGFYVFVTDLSDRRRAEQAVQDSERRFRAMADDAPAMLWITDTDNRLVYISRGWRDHTGQSLDEALRDGVGWADVVHPDDRERAWRLFEQASARREAFAFEYRLRTAAGWRWALDAGRPRFGDDGAWLGYVGSVTDVHDSVSARDALLEADRRKDEFLATLAHELRNPLAPISNSAWMLARDDAAGLPLKPLSEMLQRQVGHLVRLVDDLLEISRISRGTIELRRQRVELGEVLRAAIESASPALQAAGHRLEWQPPARPLVVDGDAVRLTQVFVNLLTNAARYTDRGGRIELTLHDGARGRARIDVRDEGIGLGPEQLPRLFQLFGQLHRDDRRSQGGLGIGLALAQRLAQMHGGYIEAASDGPGCGSVFSVHLPLAEPVPDEVAGAGPADDGLSKDGMRQRVLVVDDNHDAADSLGKIIGLLGHASRVAHDGETALALAAAWAPDIVLLDIGMPGMDGFEVARRLRAMQRDQAAPRIVALSGWAQQRDRERSREAGFDLHLAKPLQMAALQALLALPPAR